MSYNNSQPQYQQGFPPQQQQGAYVQQVQVPLQQQQGYSQPQYQGGGIPPQQIQQPPPVMYAATTQMDPQVNKERVVYEGAPREWRFGLFDFFADAGLCNYHFFLFIVNLNGILLNLTKISIFLS